MMKLLVISFLIFVPICISAQLNRVVYDERKSQNVLFGECDIDGFKLDEFNTWFEEGYNSYEVKETYFSKDFSVRFDSVYVFLGTWCSDSQREVPRFCKIMDSEYFIGTYVKYFALDGNKKTDVIDAERFYIQFVPTFVFYYHGKELCRIIETPVLSLEEDIMDLLSRIQP